MLLRSSFRAYLRRIQVSERGTTQPSHELLFQIYRPLPRRRQAEWASIAPSGHRGGRVGGFAPCFVFLLFGLLVTMIVLFCASSIRYLASLIVRICYAASPRRENTFSKPSSFRAPRVPGVLTADCKFAASDPAAPQAVERDTSTFKFSVPRSAPLMG